MNNEMIEIELLAVFKNCYKQMIVKNLNLNFNEVLSYTLNLHQLNLSNENDFIHLRNWFCNVHQLEFIKNFIVSSPHEEIIVHSEKSICISRGNHKDFFDINNLTREDFELSLEILAQKNNVSWNYAKPFVSFSTEIEESIYRISLIHFCTTNNKCSKIFLRKTKKNSLLIDDFVANIDLADFLKTLILQNKNLLISGSTGSGKTTLLKSLLNTVSFNQHIIVIEDTPEIYSQASNHTNLVAEDSLHKSMVDYCTYALRMSPDRIIVGELRSKEVVPFVLAMNTGHRGLMSTIHANSAADSITRVALLFSLFSDSPQISYETILKMVCKNLDYVIHLENKKISEVVAVLGSEGDRPIFEKLTYL